MSFLLDTNVLSELRRPKIAHVGVKQWASGIEKESAFISVINVLEIERGIVLAGARDPAHSNTLKVWLLTDVLQGYEGRILPIDLAIVQRCAQFGAVQPEKLPDALIAATAIVHDLVLVTRNINDFRAFNIPLINPWDLP